MNAVRQAFPSHFCLEIQLLGLPPPLPWTLWGATSGSKCSWLAKAGTHCTVVRCMQSTAIYCLDFLVVVSFFGCFRWVLGEGGHWENLTTRSLSLTTWLVVSLFPDQGLNPGPWQWELGVLTQSWTTREFLWPQSSSLFLKHNFLTKWGLASLDSNRVCN